MNLDVAVNSYTSKKTSSQFDDFVDKEDVTIVVPTLNEALGIGRVIEGLLKEEYYNIMIVDGYSNDETIKIAEQYDVKIIHQHGVGKTGAIQTCIEHINTPFFVVIDGDTTYNPKDIKNFLPHLRSYYQIIGVRQKGRENISRRNRFGNWFINVVFNLLFGTKLSDVCSGLYAMNTTFAKELSLDTNGFDVEVEIAAQSADAGSLTEVPISYSKRVGTQKLRPWRDGLQILYTIVKLARKYNSMILYSFIGALSIIPASMILLWVFFEAIHGNWHNGVALIGILLVMLSAQAFTISTMASQQRHLEQRIIRKMRAFFSS